MEPPQSRLGFLLVAILAVVTNSRAEFWEFGMSVQKNGNNAALAVYLYREGELSFPYRLGTSLAGSGLENFKVDIDEGVDWPNHHYPNEPNTPENVATWAVITPGKYYLRVDKYYVHGMTNNTRFGPRNRVTPTDVSKSLCDISQIPIDKSRAPEYLVDAKSGWTSWSLDCDPLLIQLRFPRTVLAGSLHQPENLRMEAHE